ncbi:MAG: glutamate formimidoyltransferase [Acidobacteriota bacterium]
MALFECIANVSDGRDPETLAVLCDAVEAAGARMLDRSADADHHRSVITFAGEEKPVEAAVLALVATALPRIDLRRHIGVHPRVGAVDVVPIVPLAADGSPSRDLGAADRLAHRLGREIARRHSLPIYFYEASARSPQRAPLPAIRRGGLAGLRARAADGSWPPDLGPRQIGERSGALVLGARPALVAYNIWLESNDLRIARDIARQIREASGGLPAVRALGLPLAAEDCVQVSMNLLDIERTPPLDAFRAVEHEARLRGVAVRGSELIGLAPRAALPPDAIEELRFLVPVSARVLEYRLAHAGLI